MYAPLPQADEHGKKGSDDYAHDHSSTNFQICHLIAGWQELDPDDTEQFWTHAIRKVDINASCAYIFESAETHPPTWNLCGGEQRWNSAGRDA